MKSSYDVFYDQLVWEHVTIDDFDPQPDSLAIHEVPCNDLTISAMIRMDQGNHLTVICHGAIDRTQKRIPFFQRVTTTLKRPGPFILFSDPVLALDPHLRLAWFAGTRETEVLPTMLAMVRRVADQLGIERVSFQGSSGGGFASLQLSAHWPGSMAYVWSPQTDVTLFSKNHVREYLAVAYPGQNATDIRTTHSPRISCLALYEKKPLRNRIYYAQNRRDDRHMTNHFEPFMRSIGVDPRDGLHCDGHVRIALVDQGPGHNAPSQRLWDEHLANALTLFDG